MSLKSLIEIAVQVESFRNIDLFHQGVYYIKFKLAHTKDANKVYASPYHLVSSNIHRLKRSQKHDPHSISPANLDDSEMSFSTRRFLIRYCEEEAELNDVAYLRIEFDVRPEFKKNEIILEADLYFSDLGGNVTPDEAVLQAENDESFKKVSSATLDLHSIAKGVHDFIPLVFDENHFCVANLIVHSELLDFRFRSHPLIQQKSIKAKPNLSLAEYLFPNRHGSGVKSYVGAEETDQVYNELVSELVESYERLRSHFLLFAGKCLTAHEREELGACTVPAHLNLPGGLMKKHLFDSLNESSGILPSDMDENKEDEAPELSISSISGMVEDERPRVQACFSERIASHDPRKIANSLIMEVNILAGQLFQLWHRLLEVSVKAPRSVCALLQEQYYDRLRDRWSESILRNIHRTKDYTLSIYDNVGELHENQSSQRRLDRTYRNRERIPIEDPALFPNPDNHPIIFEDIYFRERPSELSSAMPLSVSTDDSFEIWDHSYSSTYKNNYNRIYRGVHLFVLVHGFQGNSFDMRLLKNNLALLHPEALILCSNSNEESTEGDIGEMGVRLAQEIINFISEWCPGDSLGRLSLVGHSMGGIIIRSALPYLEQFSSKMHLFMTFSTPHLGYMYNSSRIIDAGMWLLKKWRRSRCLQQLSMSDDTDINKTFMYELSAKPGLNWFKHIALVSSYQDQYAPFDSARAEVSQRAAQDSVRGPIYIEMATNMLAGLAVDTLYRLDINFRLHEKSLDTFIGRAAHIQFLENQVLMKMLILRYPEFFSQQLIWFNYLFIWIFWQFCRSCL